MARTILVTEARRNSGGSPALEWGMRMMTAGVSDQERDILRHALGLDWARVSYRNGYSATPQADTYAVCMGLVNRGLMERGAYHETMVHFHVTDAGKALVMG